MEGIRAFLLASSPLLGILSSPDGSEARPGAALASPAPPQEAPRLHTRQCWICFVEEEESRIVADEACAARWICPCKCDGTAKWVHQHCLLSWIEAQSPAPAAGEATAGRMVTAASCPQCRTPYRIVEPYLLPRPLLSLIDAIYLLYERYMLYSTVTALGGAAWLVTSSYGLAVIVAVTAPEGLSSMTLFQGAAASSHLRPLDATAPTTAAGLAVVALSAAILAKDAIGVLLVPAYVLSTRFSSLAPLFYPIVPFLLYRGPHSLQLSWPPSTRTTACMLPYAFLLYSYTFRHRLIPAIKARLIPSIASWGAGATAADSASSRLGQPSASLAGQAALLQGDDSPLPMNDVRIPDTITVDSAVMTPATATTAAMLDADEEGPDGDDQTFRISIVESASTLMMPFFSAALGFFLFGRTRLLPFHRAAIAGFAIFLVGDCLSTFMWYQKNYARINRRVTNYTAAPQGDCSSPSRRH